jgi:anti-sigma factor RsiW
MATMVHTCSAGYDEGLLKSLVDGELSAEWRDQLRAHAAGCAACSERLSQLRMDGALVAGRLQLLSGAPSMATALMEDVAAPPRPAVAAVLARARTRPASAPVWWERVGALAGALPSLGPIRPLPLAGGTLAASVVLALSFTQPAVQTFAQGVVDSLRVQRVQPVKLDPAVLRAVPVGRFEDLSKLGTYKGPTEPRIRAANVAEAARTTGLQLRAPTALPGQLANARLLYVSEAESFSFTYDGQKLAQEAQSYGVKDAALLTELRNLNGVTVKGSVPAAAAFFYGAPPLTDTSASGVKAAATKAPAGPAVFFIQMKAPSLDVPPTINVDKLRDLALKSGAVPPQLANQLLAIQDWKTTLPIPVTRGTATQVPVDGVTGTLVVGEAPGPVLVWQKDGVLHVLAGSVSESELLTAARSLQAAR